jgi:hypothetical protein
VEAKTLANIGDVREHIGRMKKLRRHFDLRHDQKQLYLLPVTTCPANPAARGDAYRFPGSPCAVF